MIRSRLLSTVTCLGLLGALPPTARAGTETFDKGMQPILASYLRIQAALADDNTKGVRESAETIAKLAPKVDAKSVTGEHAGHYKDLPAKIEKAARALAGAKDLDSARAQFKELSKPMAMWGTMSKPEGIDVVFCSMAKGSWLQQSGGIRNPYHGKSMLTCGEVVGGAGHGKGHGGHH